MWEWSHTAEAVDAVAINIRGQSREWLEVVFAEWRASQGKGGQFTTSFDERRYKRALAYAKTLPDDVLADQIVEWTEQHRTCENGGWMAHCCPFGCICHMVPFDVVNPETGE